MSIEKVRNYFSIYGIADRIIEFDVSSATVFLAAKALNTNMQRIAKSISSKLDEDVLIIVTSGDVKIDNKKYKEEFKKKFKMLHGDEVFEKTGYHIGAVCPFDVNENVKVYLDVSLKRFETVFPACGSSNSAIELSIDELEKYCNFVRWVDVCS